MAIQPDNAYAVCGCKTSCVCNQSNFDVFVCGHPFPMEQVDAINHYGGFMGSLVDGTGLQPW